MDEKTCNRCNKKLPLNSFAMRSHEKSRDHYCVDCRRSYSREHYQKNRAKYRAMHCAYSKTEAGRESHRKWDNNNRAAQQIVRNARDSSRKNMSAENHMKAIARSRLRYAVNAGSIERLPCEVCGVTPTHGHHDNYNKPLDVQWLCEKHHLAAHGKAMWSQRH